MLYITRLKRVNFCLWLVYKVNIVMMGFKVQIRQDVAVCLFCHFQGYAVSLAKTTSLPCTEYIEETAETNHYDYRHWASGSVAG